MNLRRAAPLVFAALCLGLSAFVLSRQIAARPMPRTAAAPREPSDQEEPAHPGRPVDPKTWHVAMGPARRDVLATIGNQLAAIRTGDADRAWFYQSRALHRNFRSAQDFVATIGGGYPEFGHSRSVNCGPVWMDATGNYAAVDVTVRGQNGRLAPASYRLIREDGGYKVAGVEGGRAIK